MQFKPYYQAALNRSLYRRSVYVALVVGTLLNVINQPQLLLGIGLFDLSLLQEINYLKVVLTYLVPFFVSLHGALSVLGMSDAVNKINKC
ncbi:hypothetical protein MCAMS1_02876 [biofilm metagenome]